MFWEGDRLPRKSTNLRFINPSTMPSSSETSQGRFHHPGKLCDHLFTGHLERLFNVESRTKTRMIQDDGFCPVKIHPESLKGFELLIGLEGDEFQFPSNFPIFFVAIFFYLQIFEKPTPFFSKNLHPPNVGRKTSPPIPVGSLPHETIGNGLGQLHIAATFLPGFFTWILRSHMDGNDTVLLPREIYVRSTRSTPPNPGCNRHK